MSNYPNLSEAAIQLLIYVEAHRYRRGARLSNSPARRELKRHKLIFSRAPNDGWGRSVSGHGHHWNCTHFGEEIAQTERRERNDAELPTYSNPLAWAERQEVHP